MNALIPVIIGSCVIAWFTGLAFGMVWAFLSNIIKRATGTY